MNERKKLPRGYVEFGRTVGAINDIKIGDYVVPMRVHEWGPGQVEKIYAPWTILDAAAPGGLKRFGYHIVATHEIRNGTKNKGETKWSVDAIRRVSATEAQARTKAMLMPTSLLLRAFQNAFRGSIYESQEALDAYAAEIDRRFPNPLRTS